MEPPPPPARRNPLKILANLRNMNAALLLRGGYECVTGPPCDKEASCIRSTLQLDGDVMTTFRLVGSREDRDAVVKTHLGEVEGVYRRLQADIRNVGLVVVLAIASVPAIAAVILSFSSSDWRPLLALAVPVILGAVRKQEWLSTVSTVVASGAAAVATAFTWRMTGQWWPFVVVVLGLLCSLLAVVGLAVAHHFVRKWLGGFGGSPAT